METLERTYPVTLEAELDPILEMLTMHFNIEEIYLNRIADGSVSDQLVILVSNKYVQTLGEIIPQIRSKMQGFPDFSILCFVAFQARERIRQGNLFLYTSCRPQALVYKKKGSDFSVIHDGFDLESCIQLAQENWERENKKVDEFFQGFQFLIEKKYLSCAAFMLHQAMELTYRALEIALVAKEKLTHSIRCHHRLMDSICPMYQGVFDEESEQDIELLHILEKIYRSSRYEDSFQVDPTTIGLMEQKMRSLREKAKMIFTDIIQRCTGHKAKDQDSVIGTDQQKSLQVFPEKLSNLEQIIELTEKSLSGKVDIFLFGHRERSMSVQRSISSGYGEGTAVYYDLVIVTVHDQRNVVSSLEARINQAKGPKVTMLSYTRDQVQGMLDSNSPFMHRIIAMEVNPAEVGRAGENWRLHPNLGIRTAEENDRALRNWKFRWNNSTGFLEAARAMEQMDHLMVKINLYNQSFEQACLGILDIVQGFIPYQYNLRHLLNMCNSFWNFPGELFLRDTPEEKRFFGDLVSAVRDIRYRREFSGEWEDAYRYEFRLERFLVKCEALVSDHINSLEGKNG